MLRLVLCLVACCALCVALPSAGSAQDESADTEARSLFEAGRSAYEAGRFESALEHFERAYELSGRAGLLFNIGNVADRLRRSERALDAYRAYLDAVPDAENRALVESRIEFLSAELAAQAEGREREATDEPAIAATAPVATAEAPPPASVDPVPWILVGASGLVAIGGLALLGAAAADEASVEGAAPGSAWDDVAGAAERAPILGATGWVLLGVGVAATAGTLVWAITASDARETEVALGPASVSVRGRF